VLAAAIVDRCDVTVTHNLKDFPNVSVAVKKGAKMAG
jgi:hypothetical protein